MNLKGIPSYNLSKWTEFAQLGIKIWYNEANEKFR